MMNGHRESDNSIVSKKPSNKDESNASSAERVEKRELAKGNSKEQTKARTQRRNTLQQALFRIRQVASGRKEERLTSLWHHVYAAERLEESYYALKRKAAPGVDGINWWDYGKDLTDNIVNLSDRLRRGSYRARPVKRHYIPKADGKRRPIGITVIEDKIAQRSATEVLNAVYENEFLGFSYGFRPGRSPHHALDATSVALVKRKVNWVLDADISGFFDTIDHEWLIKFIKHRIADKRVIRHIKKWLKAGVLDEGKRQCSIEGTPQGGSISPLLANIYLHYVFDLWADKWRNCQASGDAIIVRFADDIVVGFQYRHEAEAFQRALRERFQKFNLSLHSKKTRLIEFGRYAANNRKRRGEGKPETFDFLGFTHMCSQTRHGAFIVRRKTIRQRMRRKLQEIKILLRSRMNWRKAKVGAWLRQVLLGHFRYYGVPLNGECLRTMRYLVTRMWFKILNRRSHMRSMSWKQMSRLADKWLPVPHICHPFPTQRLVV